MSQMVSHVSYTPHTTHDKYHEQHIEKKIYIYTHTSLDPPRPTVHIPYNIMNYTYHILISQTIPYLTYYTHHIHIYHTHIHPHIIYYIYHIYTIHPHTPPISHIQCTHPLYHAPVCSTPYISTPNPMCIFPRLWLDLCVWDRM